MKKVKNIIIGFGKGGKTLAKYLATQGQEVLVIEKSNQMYGGTCINIACLPSKRLIIEAGNGMDYVDAVAGKNQMTAMLRNKNYHMLADEATVTVLDGMAHFIGDHTISVETDLGTQTFEGERIFINTGSLPRIIDIPGLRESQFILDSTQAMDQTTLPKELVIIGSGYIGLEFAAMFAKYGSHVTVLDHNTEFLAKEDKDIAELIKKDLEEMGITFKLGVELNKIVDHEENADVVFTNELGTHNITANRILVATGRTPNTKNLGLENTSIKINKHRAIEVNKYLQTSVPNVWAIGDVKGGPQFTYISLDDFRIIKNQLFGNQTRSMEDRKNIPYSVFITPPLSRVGLNEKQAQAKNIPYKVFTLPVTAIPKAQVAKDSRGLFKALVNPENNEILGATLYGIESYELINMISLAMKMHIPYTVLRDQIYTHPTMSEAFNDLFK